MQALRTALGVREMRAEAMGVDGRGGTRVSRVDNADVASALRRTAELLEVGGASTHRVRAYRNAADTVMQLDRPVAQLATQGRDALAELPGIGNRLAGAIEEILQRGTFGLLSRLEGETTPEDLLATVPGIGATLAARIREELGVDTLEGLEIAAHDGRLRTVPGLGPRRVAAIRDGVGAILRRRGRRLAHARVRTLDADRPSERTLLEIDAEYRQLADAGALRMITPRRFNPERRRWLPIWHAERDGWEFDVLFSNTARAHALGKTGDWVVIYGARDGREQQCTVVTDRSGQRIVRGGWLNRGVVGAPILETTTMAPRSRREIVPGTAENLPMQPSRQHRRHSDRMGTAVARSRRAPRSPA